jgi:hypothetical protein
VLHGLAAELMTVGKSETQLEQYRQTLVASKRQMGSERELLERQFQNRWNAAVDNFAHQVAKVHGETKASILAEVSQTSLVNVAKLARDLPSITAQEIEAHLQPLAEELEVAFQQACRGIRTDYPSFDVQSTGAISIKTTRNNTLALGTASAAAAAVAGVGVVTAANAAAAASVAYVTTPTLLGAALSYFTGTSATLLTTTAVPVAAPLWVAAAGPIGWTLGGIGALTIPFAWAISKSKQRTHLEEECGKQVDKVFEFMQQQRIPMLRRSGEAILEEIRTQLNRELEQIETALRRPAESEGLETRLVATKALANDLHQLMEEKGGGTDEQRG